MSEHALSQLLTTLSPGTHVIEASAGTGKTWTITSLVAAALALGTVSPPRILTVTFTRAATAELRVRVRERIAELADTLSNDNTHDPFALALIAHAGGVSRRPELHARLIAALADADAIGVDTIHGWCATLLGQYGDLLGIDAPAEEANSAMPPVAELTERGALVASGQVNDALWQGFCARTASSAGLQQVAAAVLAGVSNVRVIAANGTVLDEAALSARFAEVSARVMQLHDRLGADWRENGDAYADALRQAIATKQLKNTSWQERWLIKRFQTVGTMLSDFTALLSADAKSFGMFEGFGATALASKTSAGRDAFTLGEFCDSVDELIALIPEFTAALAVPLRHFVNAVTAALPQKAQDFDDLLRLVAAGLQRDPAVADRVRRSADLVLIDESQDTDPLQWRIFSTLFHQVADEKALVLVGDPKQSIYRFRNAEVAVYLAARDAADGKVHALDTNYRSDPALVEAVNAIYEASPDIFGPGVRYDPVSASRTRPELVRALTAAPFTLVRVPAELPGVSDGVQAIRDEVARDVARRIADVLHAPEHEALHRTRHDEPPERVRAGDCAVLVSSNRQARQIVSALRAIGVHAVAATRSAVTQSQAAHDVQAVLRAVDSPGDRALLRAAALTALVRPALGLDASSPPRAILEALDGEPGRKLEAALRTAKLAWNARGIMDGWIGLDRELLLSPLLAASADAERRLTDVRHLLELLASHEARTRSASTETLRWMAERMQERATDHVMAEELEERLESDEDAVRVLTMHASKGLEFPLVWIPFAWVPRNTETPTVHKPLLRRYDAGAGDIEGIVPIGDGARRNNPVVVREHDALRLEQQRLLYVALTRARNACTVYVSESSKAKGSALTALLGGDVSAVWSRAAALADGAPHAITIQDIRADGATRSALRVDGETPWSPVAARWSRAGELDTLWRRGSFTALTSSHGHAATVTAAGSTAAISTESDDQLLALDGVREPAADEGEDAASSSTVREFPVTNPAGIHAGSLHAARPSLLTRVPLAHFPRGRAAGNALHDVFERVVLHGAAAGEVARAVPDALARQGLDSARWSLTLTDALEQTLDVPLTGLSSAPPSLREMARATAFTELTFDFAVASGSDTQATANTRSDASTNTSLSRVTPYALARVFSDHPGGSVPDAYADQLAALGFMPLRGMLTGAIDLVARIDGQWIITDYKSNHLGDAYGDYTAASLTHAMQSHHYILQYHLYLVALHRYLRMRQPAYEYDTHMLGIAYLFVRGMHADHAGTGVFTDLPSRARIEALDDLLRNGAYT